MKSRPNIIFILMDDLGWRDLSIYGSPFYETPNLDKLAMQGMIFSDAYASCPVCSPTRASILTGKYPAGVGVTNFISHNGAHPSRGRLIDAPYIDHLPLSEKSLASALKDGGYQTWHIGKWHLGKDQYYPEHHGFDINIGGCYWGHPGNGYFSPWKIPNLPDPEPGIFLTDYLTDRAIELVKERSDSPFFLNLWYYAVHTPIQAKEELIEKYRKKTAALGIDQTDPFVEGDFFPAEHKKHLRIKRRIIQSDPAYAALIEIVDSNIGRLMAVLDETGLSDNTIVFFTSDNGGLSTAEGSPTCNAPLAEGKGWMYEGGTREPLFVRWPQRIKAGSLCSEPVTSPDFYPTILEMAGLPFKPEQHIDGESLMPLLAESGSLKREAIYWHYPHYGNQGGTPGSSVRCGRYKLIEFFEDQSLELYDLQTDIGEQKNIISEKPETARYLGSLLKKWQEKCNACFPEPNPDFTGPV
ncbi:MAG TPA: sulfatase [Spirochaetia bacterium]|nr:sulfatase [Spirochaetia bacterium]